MNLQLKIKKRSQPEWFAWILVFMPFMFGTLFDFLPIPSVLKYTLDIAWVILLVIYIFNFYYQRIHLEKKHKVIISWIILFLVFTFIIYIFNYQSVFYYLMGIRNNFRFYVAFISFMFFVEESDAKLYLKYFDILFWINAVVMLFQLIVLGYSQDNLGGLFGIQPGCNGFINIFFIIICAKSIVFFLDKKEKTWVMLSKCGVALLLATFAEIKFFYIEFVAILIVAVIFSGNSLRKIFVFIGGIITVVICVNLLFILFPYFSDLNNIAALLEYQSKGYSGAGTVGRLNSIEMISDLFLDTGFKQLTGLGLGNCDTSTVDFLNTPFYKEYGYIRYFWFSTAHITLETGYIGFGLYTGFFALLFVLSAIELKKENSNKDYCRLSMVIAVTCILIIIYNSSLRTEAGYMIYFMLSLPFIAMKNKEKERLN